MSIVDITALCIVGLVTIAVVVLVLRRVRRRRDHRMARSSGRTVFILEVPPADLGAEILRRYRHPGSWKNGRDTSRVHLFGALVLKVEEIRLGGDAFVSEAAARSNAAAIMAWAASVGLPPYKLTIDHPLGKAPYVVVPKQYFQTDVLSELRKLTANIYEGSG
jgi:hypothetical protein